ncbi:hypothetical protein [Cereibacter sphaeroides]|uniref:hypothetical protein n=1 Tax=Cereibacter sphaeroides TaxID=1063 RepID=UPI002D7E4A98|nr:hypothetical protein [Cereibacter sphaeroides]
MDDHLLSAGRRAWHRPDASQVKSLREDQRIFQVDTEVANRPVHLAVARQQLHGTQVPVFL